MKKLVKQMLTLSLLVFSLTMMLTVGVLANGEGLKESATLTITGANPGDTFHVWRLININYDTEKNQMTYEFTPASKAYFEPKGITLEDLMSYSATDDPRLIEALSGLSSVIYADQTQDGGPSSWKTPFGGEIVAGENGTVAISDLTAGGYFIETRVSSSIYSPMFVGIVPSVDADGNYQYTDQTLAAKHAEVDIEKKVKLNSVSADLAESTDASMSAVDPAETHSQVVYQVKIGVPRYAVGAVNTKMWLEDTMPEGIVLKPETIKVYGLASATDSGTELKNDVNYQVNAGEDGFKMNFKPYYDTIKGYAYIKVEYAAEVDTITPGTDKVNNAQYTYTHYPYVDADIADNIKDAHATVKTYGIKIDKYDEDDANKGKLKNAKFDLYRPAEVGEESTVTLSVKGREYTVVKIAENQTIVTGEDGAYVIDGLKTGTYYLVETAAPSGYQLDAAPKEVIITGAEADSYVTVSIGNRTQKLTLPTTGNSGLVIFTVVGLAVMAAAFVLLITVSRKKSN